MRKYHINCASTMMPQQDITTFMMINLMKCDIDRTGISQTYTIEITPAEILRDLIHIPRNSNIFKITRIDETLYMNVTGSVTYQYKQKLHS